MPETFTPQVLAIASGETLRSQLGAGHEITTLPMRVREKILVKTVNPAYPNCWTWQAFCYKGYGRLSHKDFKTEKAHRIVYQLLRGVISDDLTIDHLCKNKSCVNPEHLEPVTFLENISRSPTLGVVNRAKTHCPYGHEYTPENIYRWRGRRICKECGGYSLVEHLERK